MAIQYFHEVTFHENTVMETSDFAPASSKEFLDIQATIECGFTLKRVRDMARTYTQIKIPCKVDYHL